MTLATDTTVPEAVLAPSHPLSRALHDVARTRHQIAMVAAVLAGAAAAAVAGAADVSLALAAGVTLVGLGCRMVLAADRARHEARNAVIDGHAGLPLACVRAECRRLSDPRLHDHLVTWLRELAAGRWLGLPMCSSATVGAVAPRLGELALLLESGCTGIRGVAMLERLLTSGVAQDGDGDARALADDLGRIRFHLCAPPRQKASRKSSL